MPPIRTDVARRFDPPPHIRLDGAHGPHGLGGQPPSYGALLCPTLAQTLGPDIEQAMRAPQPKKTSAYWAISRAQRDASNRPCLQSVPELHILRLLFQAPLRQRASLAKHCYTLLGAHLDAGERLQGLKTLQAAASFGTPRLARIVAMCVPLAQAPQRRLAMLDGLWRLVGPERLPYLMQACRPILDQRRYTPQEASCAMERVLASMQQPSPTLAPIDRLEDREGTILYQDVDDCCPDFVGDDNENVMISSRIASARHAVGIVRAHVPDPLPFAPALTCVALFVEGMAQHGCAKTQAMCRRALQTLTGNKQATIASRRPFGTSAAGALWQATGLPSLGLFDDIWAPSTPFEARADDRRLWRNVRLNIEDGESIGMGELCGLIWQAIHRFSDPEETEPQNRRKRANMRYALVAALAACSEEDGIVCPVGISQRLLTAVQGYLPFVIDGVEQEAHPQSVVTYLLQSFHHRCVKAEKMLRCEMDRKRWEAHQEIRVSAFHEEALQTGEALMGHRPEAYAIFKKHLVTALDSLYDASYLEGERLL